MIFRYFVQILLHRPDLYWTTYRIYPQCNVPQFFQQFPPDRLRSFPWEDYGSIRSKIKTHPCSTVLVCLYRDYFISFMKQKKRLPKQSPYPFIIPQPTTKIAFLLRPSESERSKRSYMLLRRMWSGSFLFSPAGSQECHSPILPETGINLFRFGILYTISAYPLES